MANRSGRLIAAVALGCGLLASVVLIQATPDAPTVAEPSPPQPSEGLQFDPPPRAPRPAPEEIGGPQGIHCVLPSGWEPTSSAAQFVQASRSDAPGTFFRLGGRRAGHADLMSMRLAEEKAYRRDYQRLQLEQLTYRSASAVLWEFQLRDRRIRVLAWREGGAEYFIYLSAAATSWSIPLDVAFADLMTHTRVD
ncbi:hypothetical protein [Actinocrispum sp. NPDC049592]|uniref:hypothetical protein n=1 Tax=Actinocrispum sp. NPDC049592 TaxID=3154835 RepID=UPI00341F0205